MLETGVFGEDILNIRTMVVVVWIEKSSLERKSLF